jgi:hypothetical protein
MNALDFAIIIALIAAGLGGYRLGFIARVFAWTGVAIGLVIGIHYVPRVVTAFGGTSADDRVTVAVLFLVLVATLGQAVGLGVGVLVHRVSANDVALPRWDRVAGATIGVVGVIALVWMTIPSLATAKGWPARMARGSSVIAIIDDVAPTQPAQFAAWGRAISDAPYPSALGPLDSPPDPGLPPEAKITPEVDRTVRQSIVKVSGRACRQIQEGSGWVTTDGLIVTNAHVVAGEGKTEVEDSEGQEYNATVVAFDPVRDLAVLAVDTCTRRASSWRRAASATRAPCTDTPAVATYAPRPHGSARRSWPSAPTSTGPVRVDATSSCWRPRSRPATRAARSSTRRATSSASRSRSTPGTAERATRSPTTRSAPFSPP